MAIITTIPVIKRTTHVHSINDLINNPHDRQGTSHTMRNFTSITTTLVGTGVLMTAVADDGTAWIRYGLDNWTAITPLPQPTVDPLIDDYAATILAQHADGNIDTRTAFDYAYDLNDDAYQRVHGELKHRDMEKRLIELKALGANTQSVDGGGADDRVGTIDVESFLRP